MTVKAVRVSEGDLVTGQFVATIFITTIFITTKTWRTNWQLGIYRRRIA